METNGDTKNNDDDVNEYERVYLYAPIEYKEQVKKLGALWDESKSEWFSYKSNPNFKKLIDIFHECNFRMNFYGERMLTKIKTENERIEEDRKSLAEYGKLLEEYKK